MNDENAMPTLKELGEAKRILAESKLESAITNAVLTAMKSGLSEFDCGYSLGRIAAAMTGPRELSRELTKHHDCSQ